VARAIAAEIGKQSLPHVWLDISHRPRSFILEHFPTIHAHCLAHGIDITRSPIPVGPAQLPQRRVLRPLHSAPLRALRRPDDRPLLHS